jgi:periplasmic protein TonB
MGDDARIRLSLALALSVALHLSLIFGIAVGPAVPASAPTIVARLVPKASSSTLIPAEGMEVHSLPRDAAPAVGNEVRKREPIEPLRAPEPDIQSRPAHIDESLLPRADVPLLVDPVWYAAKDLDVYPRPVVPVESIYPETAVDVAGEVSLLLKIDEFGAVREITVVKADPAGYFEDAAARAFKAASFSPAQRDGHPVRSQVVVKMRFAPELQASAAH